MVPYGAGRPSARVIAPNKLTHSVDGFTAGFPVTAAFDGRDAIVALAMGGEVLPVIHGYPARLVVPGLKLEIEAIAIVPDRKPAVASKKRAPARRPPRAPRRR